MTGPPVSTRLAVPTLLAFPTDLLAVPLAAPAALHLTQATDRVTDNTPFSSDGARELTKLVLRHMCELNLSPVPYLR
ncbi:hypothetical protein [Nonomuraea rubra]|uniref:Uncharacterized protein n=1 Tax=Nonomuraea rubra TaxID=46180 RepID=A0A7X0U0D4_9ACTN|nr:hypothetical protein [Nonomuraea rubra]MBB6550200.1 hypothetical protein [Nonomuraea rubra]